MAASKRLIQLGSRLRAIQVSSAMNTPALMRRSSINSYRLFSSSSSVCGSEYCRKQDQGLELSSLRHEFTKLQCEIGNIREKLENKDQVLHLKRELSVRDMSDETKKLISGATKTAIKYSISITLLGALGIYLFFPAAPPAAPPLPVEIDPVAFIFLLFISLVLLSALSAAAMDYCGKGQNGRNGRNGQKG